MKIQQEGDTLFVGGIKELDAASAFPFQENVNAAATEGVKNVEIDLSQTVFLDSCGLGALVALRKTLGERGGVVRLLNPTPSARQILELTRLHRIFEITRRETVATG